MNVRMLAMSQCLLLAHSRRRSATAYDSWRTFGRSASGAVASQSEEESILAGAPV